MKISQLLRATIIVVTYLACVPNITCHTPLYIKTDTNENIYDITVKDHNILLYYDKGCTKFGSIEGLHLLNNIDICQGAKLIYHLEKQLNQLSKKQKKSILEIVQKAQDTTQKMPALKRAYSIISTLLIRLRN